MCGIFQRAFSGAVSTIQSASVKRRLDKTAKLEKKCMEYTENINMIEEDIHSLLDLIQKENIELMKVDLTHEDVTVPIFLEKTELISMRIATMNDDKRKLIKKWMTMKEEFESVEKKLDETKEKAENSGRITRLCRFFSGICCLGNI
ncbi:uncharacterized protein ACNLHF_025273 [Anomaloglossus baeobatrachus]